MRAADGRVRGVGGSDGIIECLEQLFEPTGDRASRL